ncbi:MAG: hypothetical protein Q9212_003162 [Teloschistes hypoglaucus]
MVGIKRHGRNDSQGRAANSGNAGHRVQAAWGAPLPLRLLGLGVIPAGDYDTSLDPPFSSSAVIAPSASGTELSRGTRSEAIKTILQSLLWVQRMVPFWRRMGSRDVIPGLQTRKRDKGVCYKLRLPIGSAPKGDDIKKHE